MRQQLLTQHRQNLLIEQAGGGQRVMQAVSSSGSSTLTIWKRRSSAASRSKYCLYSLQVVAAMVRSSPRARAGFSRLAASAPPAWLPAPIMVWASSINSGTGTSDFCTASMTFFRRCSNSPFTP